LSQHPLQELVLVSASMNDEEMAEPAQGVEPIRAVHSRNRDRKAPRPAVDGDAEIAAETASLNLLACGCTGCHVVDASTTWILGAEQIDPVLAAEFRATISDDDEDDDEADFSCIQFEGGVFTIINSGMRRCTTYVSIMGACIENSFKDRHGRTLGVGQTTSLPKKRGRRKSKKAESTADLSACMTFIFILEPFAALHVANIVVDPQKLDAYKLGFQLNEHPSKEGEPELQLRTFPLNGQGPFLCTQGFGGRLTHFFPESYHAIDLRCDEGTEVVAVADGIITDVTQQNCITGIHCHNLCTWNSISLTSGEHVIDYVHIAPGSAVVQNGSVVKAGDVICLAGRVGFAPEPHLHLEIHAANDLKGPSIPFCFHDAKQPFLPIAGNYYGPEGEVQNSTCDGLLVCNQEAG